MFKNRKIRKLFKNDDPRLIPILENKNIDLCEVFKEEADIIERSIKYHKNVIAEGVILYETNINKVNKNNQSYLMIAVLYDNFPMFTKLLEKEIKLDVFDNNRESVLFYAIKSNNKTYFNVLIEKGIDIKGYNNNGENTAIYAYINNKKEIAYYLLKNKVFINHIDKDGNTILHYAVKNNDIDFALKLLELGADVFIKNYNGQSVLDISKELQVEEIIINKVNDIISSLFEEDNNEKIIELLEDYFDVEDYSHFNIPFLIAYNSVVYNKKQVFDKILRNIKLLNSLDYKGKSLLMYCIDYKQFLLARKIMYLDSNLNLQDIDNKTVLFNVVLQLQEVKNDEVLTKDLKGIFNELIDCHVDVNLQDNLGNTVLMYAINNKQEDIIDKLINYSKIDLNLANYEGKTALILAYEAKDLTTVHKIIISRKAEINTMDKDNNNLLLLTLLDDNLELFTALLYNGANLNLKYQNGMTILMIALQMQKLRFVAKIFEHPFNFDLRDNNGMTALMHAIKIKNVNVVKALLKLGANKYLADKNNISPIYLALDLDALDIAKLLKNSEDIINQ